MSRLTSDRLSNSPEPLLRNIARSLRDLGYNTRSSSELVGNSKAPEALLARAAFFSFLACAELDEAPSCLSILTQLFILGGQVEKARARALLPEGLLSDLFKVNWLQETEGTVCASVSLVEYRDRFFVADKLFDNLGGEIVMHTRGEWVMPIHESSLYLHGNAVAPVPHSRVLDVGTGCGCLAILAEGAGTQKLGIDLSARAVQFARINAMFNGDSSRFEVANCMAFVSTTPFDHILFNSPTRPNYRGRSDPANFSSELGQEFIFQFLADRVPSLLSEAGICQIWGLLSVQEPFRTVDEMLGARLSTLHGFAVDIRVARQSAFFLSAADLARGRVPTSSYLLEESQDGPQLIEFLRAHQVREVLPSLITVRRTAGTLTSSMSYLD